MRTETKPIIPRRYVAILVVFLGSAWIAAAFSPATSHSRIGMVSLPPGRALSAGFNGRTFLSSIEALDLKIAGGAGIHDVEWLLDGQFVGNTARLYFQRLLPGDHLLRLTYLDAQNRPHMHSTTVRVLEPDAYEIEAGALEEAITLPLWVEDPETFLPLIIQ